MSPPTLNRPAVSNPRPIVTVDGQRFEKIDALLLALDMREQEGGLASLELRLSNWASDADGGADFAFEAEAEVHLGSTLVVSTGDLADSQEIFRGIVTALEAEFSNDAPPELLILAEDRLQLVRQARRTEIYQDMSLADIATAIAQRFGLQAQITGLSDSTGLWVQLNESDLAFLRRLLRQFDAEVQIVGDRLQAMPFAEIRRQSLELHLGEDLRRVRFIADLAHQVSEVTSGGWNASSGEAVSGIGRGVSLGPGSGRSGASLLAEALAERSEHVGHIAVTTTGEAQALADAVYDQRARRFVTAEGTATGHPGIRVGCHLRLSGVSPRFTNTYAIISTHHRFDLREGYMTDFVATSAYLGTTA